MRRFLLCFSLLLSVFLAVSCIGKEDGDFVPDFEDGLSHLHGVVSVTKEDPGTFKARYKIFFEQPLDHDNPSAGKYKQLVYVMLNHPDSVNVLVTEGYYAFDAAKVQELVPMFGANQIVVEHRYFGESTVGDPSYRYMDAKGSCDDLHEVVTALKALLSGKWVSTGVSKSGMTSLMYRAWYPDDVEVTVPYGTPLCNERYDKRFAKAFEESIGTPEDRDKVTAFMRELLRRRDVMASKFDSLAVAQNVTLPLPAQWMWDLHVIDWQGCMWLFGLPLDDIPALDSSDNEMFNYVTDIDGPDAWDRNNDVNKYYVQAYRELGHYECATAGIEDLLVIDRSVLADFLRHVYMPGGVEEKFSTAVYERVDAFLRGTDARCMFIYGGYDPWMYVGIGEEYANGDNILRYERPGGFHHAAISDFDDATRREIERRLRDWLD